MAHVAIEQVLADDRFIRRLALRLMGDRASADDVAQDVYLKALKQGHREPRSLRGWLAAATRSLAANARRARERRARREGMARAREAHDPECLVLEREEVRKCLIASIVELGAPRSTILLLRYFEDVPPRVIARRLGMPVESVRTHLKRGLAALRARLSAQRRPDGSSYFAALPLLAAGARGLGATVEILVMTLKGKTALVGACVLLAAAGVWLSIPRDRKEEAPQTVAASESPSRPLNERASIPGAHAPVIRRLHPQDDEPETAASVPALDVEVISADGIGEASARIVAYANEDIIGSGDTDAEGRLRLPGRTDEVNLVVAPRSGALVLTKAAPAIGRCRIVLARGAAISGRVEVDGQTPAKPVEISLSGSQETGRLPGAVRKALDTSFRPRTSSDVSGRFAFTGLKPESDYKLFTDPGAYRELEIVSGTDRLIMIRAPQSDVVVRLHRYPVVTGRVVAESSRAAVPKARAEVPFQLEPGVSTSSTKTCDDQGRFALPLRNPPDSEVNLRFLHPDGIGERIVRLAPVPERDIDIGDVELPELRALEFIVRDPTGAPIAGALASLENLVIPSTRTDGNGRGSIRVGHETRSFRIGALKHEVVEVPVPAGDQPIEVTLRPNAGLEIRVVDPDGACPRGILVRISAQELRDPNRFNTIDLIYAKAGASSYRAKRKPSDAGESEVYELNTEGRVVIAGLRPTSAVLVEAIDVLEQVLTKDTVALVPEAWQSVNLLVKSRPKKIRGIVVDPEGRPVGDVSVSLVLDPEMPVAQRSFHDQPAVTRSNVEGRFELPEVHSVRINLEAAKTGYVPYRGAGLALPSDGSDLTIVLHPGKDLTITVVFDDGRPVTGLPFAAIRATFPDLPLMFARETREGAYLFTGLPHGRVKISVTFRQPCWTWERAHDPALGPNEMRFVIPAPGKVAVTWEMKDGPAPPYRIRLQKVGAADSQILARTHPNEARSGTVSFSDILPGEYSVVLETLDGGTISKLVGPLAVTVASGETASVSLRP